QCVSLVGGRGGGRRALHSCPTRRSSDLDKLQTEAIDVEDEDHHPHQESDEIQIHRLPQRQCQQGVIDDHDQQTSVEHPVQQSIPDRKSTRLNSSHVKISYAVFCLKKKNT